MNKTYERFMTVYGEYVKKKSVMDVSVSDDGKTYIFDNPKYMYRSHDRLFYECINNKDFSNLTTVYNSDITNQICGGVLKAGSANMYHKKLNGLFISNNNNTLMFGLKDKELIFRDACRYLLGMKYEMED